MEESIKKNADKQRSQVRIPFTSLKYFDAYRLYQITGVYYQRYNVTLFGQAL
ncbi:hypothetical protein J4P91_10035 [Bacillus sp. XF8]|nr:hypothetical protein [Bacillus sp. XF8]